jgi:hypothetical protein
MSWKRRDVLDGKRYYVALCQCTSGHRYYELCEVASAPSSKEAVLLTAEVPNSLLAACNYEAISNTVPLTNGRRFYVEAHGVWLTEDEVGALGRDEEREIPWLNGIAATFPPK